MHIESTLMIKEKFFKEKIINFKLITEPKEKILKTGINMLESSKVFMSFNDEKKLYVKLAQLKDKFLNKKNIYSYYNFPRAWLMIGLLDEFEIKRDENIFKILVAKSDALIDKDGNLHFHFDKIDQSLFGLVFLRLFMLTKKTKYKSASDQILSEIKSKFVSNKDQVIFYRSGVPVCFVDTLGMVCPFLYEYANVFSDGDIRGLANNQLRFYIEHAFERDSNFPFHAFDISNNLKVGPTNWARGLGWFLIGLSYAIKYSTPDNNPHFRYFEKMFFSINDRLNSLQHKDCYWAQFLGHTNDNSIDSSATLMFHYARMIALSSVNNNKLELIIKNCVNEKGCVFNSSGDTIYINKYSKQKGYSEMSQGLLISLLSKHN